MGIRQRSLEIMEMNYAQLTTVYKGKKVLLTGHTGFKGSWLLGWLHQLGAIVKGYALAPLHKNDLYCLLNGDKLCESVIADLRDGEKLLAVIKEFQPDFIFHLAAQPLVRRSYKTPAYTFEVNTGGAVNLLDALRSLEKKCTTVIITTDKVYENREINYAYQESDKLGGYDPYSASKAAAEIVVSSYRNSFFNPDTFNEHGKAVATARAGNVIGGGDRSEDRIIPDIIRAFEKNEPIVVRNPKAVRPWQHVLEPIGGYLLLGAAMEKDPVAYSEAWNFGPNNDDVLTVREVVESAIKEWGSGSYETPSLSSQPHEAGLLKLDISKTVKRLDWKPKMNSSEAISGTMRWYKQVKTGQDAINFTYQQIAQYQEAQ